MSNKPKPERTDPVLLGSTFPLSLIRRRVVVSPEDLESLRLAIGQHGVASFWGHANTLSAAAALLGADITPVSERPALHLNADGFPSLDGQSFDTCWVLSPDYVSGFRPSIGEEVSTEKITGWQVLKMEWIS